MTPRRALAVAIVIVLVAVGAGVRRWSIRAEAARARQVLYDEIMPVALTNCVVERYGDSFDGGYLSCKNLLAEAAAVYSYGINAQDEWGCDISDLIKAPVHQYDCFNPIRPNCAVGAPVFHDECIGPARVVESGRPYDTLESQIARNGDAGKRLIVKMDVEGSEWPSLLGASDQVLDQIDQLSVEFHSSLWTDAHYLDTIRKLKRIFYIAHVHDNNWACDPAAAPFTTLAIEVLFVNKRIGKMAPNGARPPAVHPLDSKNNSVLPDCQAPR
jgi:hypothetical protein